MGSLTSRPKVPDMPKIPALPQSSSPEIIMAQTGGGQNEEHKENPHEDAQAVRKKREDNLLRRDRGVLGTVQTGFRGLLSQSARQGNSKNLLGE